MGAQEMVPNNKLFVLLKEIIRGWTELKKYVPLVEIAITQNDIFQSSL